MKPFARLMLMLALAAFADTASAHKPSDAYLTLERTGGKVSLRVDLALRDAERVLAVDADGDGAITWGEVRTARSALMGYVATHTRLSADGQACRLQGRRLALARHSDGPYAALGLSVSCPGGALPDAMGYTGFFAGDPLHRGLLAVADGRGTRTAVFSPDQRRIQLDGETGLWRTARDYLVHGVWHIWVGYDHLLFLLVLLLPAVIGRDLRGSLGHTVRVVTAFTLAHSITLSLAALGMVSPPTMWVEAAIAASIVAVGIGNLVPAWRRHGWVPALAFGLLHGLGFASVLQGLGLPTGALIPALLSFNLGVELGQLAVVTGVLPLLYALRRSATYRTVLMPGGSVAAAAIATVWVVQRLA